ncbi:T9SS type B sorting domain-containing protein [Hanstruepera marina]|uniref:T9SS type B sorting domain-containing protein n=1 Tax=Hanstruepera marina TaxID=2873265 RepID=UPI001CA7711D|nr:T9SS type B sorting domain-containing protein [Hanstruepera marina]
MKLHVTRQNLILAFAFCLSQFCLVAQQPTDCVNAITVCGDSNINLDVNGIGTQEFIGLNTCSSVEHNSLWLKVTVVTDGTLGFTLTPQSTDLNEDYDFFVFGPNPDCGNLSPAIRCSTTNPLGAGLHWNLTGMNGAETDTSEGPGPDGNSFVSWLDVVAGDTYFIVIDRPIGNSPFNLEWTGTAEFASPPTNESSSSLELNLSECDAVFPFDDFMTTFDLSVNTDLIIGSQTNVSVTYYESETDASIGSNQITGLYTNISNPQEVYAKITDDDTGCFEIIPFNLIVGDGANYPTPSDYILCDDYNDGDNSNGQVIFDLESKNEEILVGQNPDDLNITYHESYSNAEFNLDPLPNYYHNTTPYLEEVFIRIENAANVNCFSIRTLNLIVLETPEAFNAVQVQCSYTASSIFNLTNSNGTLTGNTAGRSTLFYTSFNDAQNDINVISNSSSYTSVSNPQTIYVRVVDDNTDCFSISELELQISSTTVNNTQIIECDTDGTEDGLFQFDLNQANADILNGTPIGSTIAYYATIDDALLETNALSPLFTNTIPNQQVIFARVENVDECYGIAEIELFVFNLPDIDTEETLFYCLNTYPNTITIDSGEITSPSSYSYLWSTNETTYAINVNEVGTYSVQVTNNTTNCSVIRTITVEPSNIATIESVEVVDATDNNSITVITSGEGDYEYALYNEFGLAYPYQSENSFNNISPGIYTLSIRDVKNNCGIIDYSVSVIGFPKVFTPNGDGDNDLWNIKGNSNIFHPNSKILIFDRYGKLLTQINPLGPGWDGTINGTPLPVSDYWFAATLQDGRVVKDHFTLKR